jgi:hypothetical protein
MPDRILLQPVPFCGIAPRKRVNLQHFLKYLRAVWKSHFVNCGTIPNQQSVHRPIALHATQTALEWNDMKSSHPFRDLWMESKVFIL